MIINKFACDHCGKESTNRYEIPAFKIKNITRNVYASKDIELCVECSGLLTKYVNDLIHKD